MSGLQLEAEVALSVGGVHDAVHGALRKHHDETKSPKPIFLRRSDSRFGDGANLVTLDVGAPPLGRTWQVTYCTLFGNDDHTAVASVVGAIYTGNPNSLSLAGLIVPGLAFPSSTQISDDVLWVHANNNLCIRSSVAGVVGQQYGVNFVILEYRSEDVSLMSGR